MHGTNIGYSVAKIGNSNLKMVERTERGCATKGNQRAAAEFQLIVSPCRPQMSHWQMEVMRAAWFSMYLLRNMDGLIPMVLSNLRAGGGGRKVV